MWNAIFGSSEEPSPTALEVTFTLNGKQVTVGNEVVEGTSLNTYIRDVAKLKGTKFMCTEGGCGACVVAATIEHPVTKQKQTLSINSCLVPVFACHGWDIRTVEGIGNKRDGYHPVQANLAQFNGTQCGFCSPGMVMNMYSLVADGKTPTMAEVENAFGGNLCRCTGYRSILDAFKALAKDATPMMKKQCADIEDMYKICSKTGLACSGSCKKDSNFEEIVPKSVKIPAANWYKVTTLNDLFSVITSLGATVYQLSAGNTAEGVYRHYNRQFDARIDVKDVPDLRTINTSGGFTVGANVTLTEAIAAFKTQAAITGYSYLTELANHLDVVANTSVRNNYKVPGAKDIPADFRINFRKNASNPLGLLNSKATGEPALNMSIVCFFALRNALDSARKDAGDVADYYDIKLPATVETIAMTSLTDTSQFTFA
ncbi:xanthine dehydrogenase-like [Neocloeon triangulifer]|uniref:xanthine dehydrogenase-like n=1 Tax=Neocloeon triangulifer TaxID=2078957 RepID=UPI00286F5196|nr:xanthine dehydrogenase-like [Neocloeon triangulifer]